MRALLSPHMEVRTQRWILSCVSALLACALGVWVFGRIQTRKPPSTITFRERNEAPATVEFPVISQADFFLLDESTPLAARAEDRRFYMSREAVEHLWGNSDRGVVYDPWTYSWDAGGRDERYPWPEHPQGRWHLTTNRAGLRELGDSAANSPPSPPPSSPPSPESLRVLATGDSHAFGVCDTDETFAAELERMLSGVLAPRGVQVLNASQPGFDAFNYLGVLQRFLDFQPQTFVALCFGGNDLLSALDLYYRFTQASVPVEPEHDHRRRAEVAGRAPSAFGQCYDGATNLLLNPEEGELAARINARLYAEMKSICDRRGIRFLVVYLPSPCDLRWRDPPAEIEIGRRLSGIPLGAGSGLRATEARFLELMSALSIEVIDMRSSFAALDDPPYWRRDLHLNLVGHRMVAEALAPRIAPQGSAR